MNKLFFGCQLKAVWPAPVASGRIVEEPMRHITLAFLGEQETQKILEQLLEIPAPPFQIAPAGIFNECLFMPPRRAHLVAYNIEWVSDSAPFLSYQKMLSNWLVEHEFMKPEKRDFWPHVTVCRHPFDRKGWAKTFYKCPFTITAVHLYNSLGHSTYESLHEWPLLDAFTEIEHTADMAFTVRGQSMKELHRHAEMALAFHFPPFIGFFAKEPHVDTLDDLISDLNSMIAYTDAAMGCPLKAVSYHGELKKLPHKVLEWEMIVDV